MCIHIYDVILSEFRREITVIFTRLSSAQFISFFQMSNNWFWIISFWISNISRIWNSILISYICVHMFLGIVIVYVIQISVLHTIMKSTSENLVGDSWIFSIILLTILLLRRHCCTETLKVYKKYIKSRYETYFSWRASLLFSKTRCVYNTCTEPFSLLYIWMILLNKIVSA